MAQKWNSPRSNIIKVVVTLVGFLEMGLNDSSTGAVLPFVEEYYNLDDMKVSFMFLVGILGALTAALSSGRLHKYFGRRGASWTGISCQLLGFLLIGFIHENFHSVLLGQVAIGLGSGFLNGSWNAWIGAFEDAHGILGILHGFYALGGMIGPAVISLIVQHDKPWFDFYRILMVYCAIVLSFALVAFSGDDAKQYQAETKSKVLHGGTLPDDGEAVLATGEDEQVVHTPTITSPLLTAENHPQILGRGVEANPFACSSVWILASFLCSYNGVEIGYSGWIVTYMIREKNGDPKYMALISTIFWTGLTLGRVVLGFVTGRFSNLRNVILFYFAGAIAFHVVFWLQLFWSTMMTDSICIFFVGLFIGPIYPSAMVMATMVLPTDLHVSGISTAAAISGCGAALLPLGIGTIVQKLGMHMLPLIILCSLVFTILLWLLLCAKKKKSYLLSLPN